MTPARALLTTPLPPLRDPLILCLGLRLEGPPEQWLDAAAPHVTDSERARARRFLHPADAARHLAGRALARRMLRTVEGLENLDEFDLSPLGRPLCPAALQPNKMSRPVSFSISHSGAMVWTAFCRGDQVGTGVGVGIDVEALRPLPELFDLAGQLHPQECAEIRALPEPERLAAFYRCWTRKEAVLKALGQGLSQPLHSFRVLAETDSAGWVPSGGVAATGWTCRDIDAGAEHLCAVSANAPGLGVAAHVLGE